MKNSYFQSNITIGYRNCSGQYNGGYPCLGASIQYNVCATNVTCPREYFSSHY